METARDNKKGIQKRNYLIVLIVMIMLSILFARSFYWPSWKGYSKRIITEVLMIAVGITAVPWTAVKVGVLNHWVSVCVFRFTSVWGMIWRNKVRVICIIALYILLALLGYNLAKIPYVIGKSDRFNPRFGILLVAILYLILTFMLLCRVGRKRIDLLFLATALIIGSAYIRITPGEIATSWDDQIHYVRTLGLSNGLNGIMYSSDKLLIKGVRKNPIRFSRESQQEYNKQLTELYQQKKYSYYQYRKYISLWSVAYIPAAIGIVFGRGLGLPYIEILKLGRFFNLLFYALIISAAIRRIKYGKTLIACCGLIPSAVFLACSYSYDFWVICLGIYGYALFYSILQDAKHTASKHDLIAMLAACLLGFIPKMVYFPLLLPLWFIPKNRFESRRKQRYFRLALIAVVVLLLLSFFCGFWEPDYRGGSGVDPAGQVRYILSAPIQYVKLLYHFLIPGYLSPITVNQSFLDFAYLGAGASSAVLILILYVLSFIDRGDSSQEGMVKVRIAGLLGVVLAVMIVATALYVSYTPVAAASPQGVQVRYLFPVLLPFFMLIGADKISYRGSKRLITMIALAVFAGAFLRNVSQLIVSLY